MNHFHVIHFIGIAQTTFEVATQRQMALAYLFHSEKNREIRKIRRQFCVAKNQPPGTPPGMLQGLHFGSTPQEKLGPSNTQPNMGFGKYMVNNSPDNIMNKTNFFFTFIVAVPVI